MLSIHFIQYLFYISEYKAMLIQLLICYIYIYIWQIKSWINIALYSEM